MRWSTLAVPRGQGAVVAVDDLGAERHRGQGRVPGRDGARVDRAGEDVVAQAARAAGALGPGVAHPGDAEVRGAVRTPLARTQRGQRRTGQVGTCGRGESRGLGFF